MSKIIRVIAVVFWAVTQQGPLLVEHRCPDCNKLIALSEDFAGSLNLYCPRCKTNFGDTGEFPRLECSCRAWLAAGVITGGWIQIRCHQCRRMARLTSTGPVVQEPRRWIRPDDPPFVRQSDSDLVALIEERWESKRALLAWSRAEVAVGLRFDVFQRDGFRCRYCGRTPADGVALEADHVIPRLQGEQAVTRFAKQRTCLWPYRSLDCAQRPDEGRSRA